MTTMQQATKTVIETGEEIKSKNIQWQDLDDDKRYQVTRLYTPFGNYVMDVQPVCEACKGDGIFHGIDTIPTTCCKCDGTGIERKS